MKKRLLITGGSHAELPLIEVAKSEGWYVISTGTNRDGIGHERADEYVYGDFSDKEFVLALAREKKVKAIVSGCNDFAYLSTAYACDNLHLPGHDNYEISRKIHHKDAFREQCRLLGIRTPEARICYSVDDAIEASRNMGFPVMVKPVDLTGGKGVRKCCNESNVREAFSVASALTRESKILVEKFIEGSNHGGSFLLKSGKVVANVVDDEQYGENKYLVSGATMPAYSISNQTIHKLVCDIEILAKYLRLVDGLFHVQFIVADDGYPYMIDPCRRTPGDLYVLLSRFASGVNFPLEIVRAETGELISSRYDIKNQCIARECVMTDCRGRISSVYIDDSIRDKIIYKLLWHKKGEYIDDPQKYKAGILIMKFSTMAEMRNIVSNFDKFVKIKFLEGFDE